MIDNGLQSNDTEINKIVAKLEEGQSILYPTDTIWGLGCDATNQEAVEKIFSIKERKPEKPFLLLVDSIEMLRNYVDEIPPRIETLLSVHKKPLTLLYPKAKNLPSVSIANDNSVGIRICHFQFTKRVIREFGKPLISTSANIAGQPSPSFFHEIQNQVRERVDYIVPFYQEDNTPKTPSVIAKIINNGKLHFIR